MVVVDVRDLRRCFGPIVAVDGISFQVAEGEVLGVLGPNGAGKSTAMRMLAGFLAPDSGEATICGFDLRRQSVQLRKLLGYLAESAPLYDEMTPASFLRFVCDARGLRGAERLNATDRVTADCSIESVYHQAIGTLSKGYRRRVGLAQALIHDPDLLILDEPTDGLDPNQKHEVRQMIGRLAKDKCIIISTHILEEVEAVCTRAIIMAHGRILVDSTPEAMKREHDAPLDAVFRKLTGKKEGAA